MTVFDDCISESILKKRYIDIYRDNQSEDTIFGIIIKDSDSFLCMVSVNDNGLYDGIHIIKKEHVTRIRWGGKERQSIEKIIKDYEITSNAKKIELESIKSIIKSVNKLFGYAVVYVEDADPDICFIGEIEQIDDEDFLMKEFGTMKSLDRSNLIVSLQEVTSVSVDGIYERNLLHLHKHN